MAKKQRQPLRGGSPKMQGFIAGAGEIVQQDISDTPVSYTHLDVYKRQDNSSFAKAWGRRRASR